MNKVKNGLCPDYIFRLFVVKSNQYNSRPRVMVSIRSVLWSKIDRKFRELKTVHQIKELSGRQFLPNISYLKIVLTVLFIILNILIIFRFVGEIIEGIIWGI